MAGRQADGLLDWDFAEPGERITDLAQVAWYFGPLRGEDGWAKAGFTERPDFGRRVGLIAAEYGAFSSAEILREVDRLQHADMEITQRLGGSGVHPWNLFYDRGGMEILRRENAWLQETML